MWYYILRILIGFYSKVYFRKLYFTGLDKLPKDRPLILALNHPTAFIDPILMGGATLQARNFLLRGDMFRKGKWVEAFLHNIKCIPIFRFRDGFAELKNNQATMEYCYDLLGEGQNLVILAEGIAKHEKRMRPIQKGTARMAFGAYEKHNRSDIAVIPVGINYTDSLQFRSVVYADVGDPIPIQDFLEDHAKNPRRAIKRLTDRLSKEMRQRIIHIAKEEDDELGHQLLVIAENTTREKAFPRFSYEASSLSKDWELIERLNDLPEAIKNTLKSTTQYYFDRLKKLGVSDLGIAQSKYYSIGTSFLLLLSLPVFLIGLIGNILPIQIGKYYAEKAANTPEFNSSLRFAFEMLCYVLYFIILLVIAAIFGNWGHLLFVLALPLFGHLSLQWLDFFKLWKEGRKVKGLAPKELEEVLTLRKELFLMMNSNLVDEE